MVEVILELKNSLNAVLNRTVETVASKLSAKNAEIYNAATEVLDSMMEHLGEFYNFIAKDHG